MTPYDDIIVGGGSAGCVLAARLSEDPGRRVLLIEAGPDTPPEAVPEPIADSYPMALFHGDRFIWPGLQAVAARGADGAPVTRAYEQARVMGGGSSINVQSANRGLPRDYDGWATLGATGWGWDDVLPYFRKLERDLDFDGPLHGDSGPIPIRRIGREAWPPFAEAAYAAWSATGLPYHPDQNGSFEDGLFPAAFSNERDRRVSAAQGYLTTAVRARPNLAIQADTLVHRLLMDGRRTLGVEVRRRDGSFAPVYGRRVLLTAGALQSPALLLRAGVGAGDELQRLGIPVAIEREGVGRNLRDHPALTFAQYLPPALRLPMSMRRASFLAMRYSSGLEGGSASDMYVTAAGRAGWHGLGERLALYFLWCNQPHSAGRVHLVSPDASGYPGVDLGLLSDARDLPRLMDGVRRLVALVVCAALNPHPGDVFPAAFSPAVKALSVVSVRNRRIMAVLGRLLDMPGPVRRRMLRGLMLRGAELAEVLADDERLAAFIRARVFGVWHPVGTCRMGQASDAGAVVDPTGLVIGSGNLFVADASIMPRLPTANTNIPVIMAAEKIADGLRRG